VSPVSMAQLASTELASTEPARTVPARLLLASPEIGPAGICQEPRYRREPRDFREPRYRREGRPGSGVRAPAGQPLRLTRRGRVTVLACFAALAVALLVVFAGAAGGAQATGHRGGGRAGYQGMTQVVVQPGQTLWAIASAARPAAYTQTVIQQIADANGLKGTTLRAGQILWVPRS